MNAGLLVDLYVWSNPITGILAIANVVWIVILVIQAVINHEQLNKFVTEDTENGKDNWEVPLVILFVLAAAALAIYFTPFWIPQGLGWSTFIIPIACFAFELFIINDYRVVLSKHIWKSWYWRSTLIGEYLVAITLVSSIVYFVLARLTTNY